MEALGDERVLLDVGVRVDAVQEAAASGQLARKIRIRQEDVPPAADIRPMASRRHELGNDQLVIIFRREVLVAESQSRLPTRLRDATVFSFEERKHFLASWFEAIVQPSLAAVMAAHGAT